MTTPIKVDDDNHALQIMDAMDSIRARVWHDHNVQPHWRDRLTDTAGLRARQPTMIPDNHTESQVLAAVGVREHPATTICRQSIK